MKISGKCSWFGGPNDMGVSPSEGLAFIYELDDAPHLFLPSQPSGTTGLARRLDPAKLYIACRWDYNVTSKDDLLNIKVLVRSPKTGKEFLAEPADWGPHQNTNRIADLSPGLMDALGITTDDTVEVTIPAPGVTAVPATAMIAMSSGHGLKIRGASGFLDEVNEARRVVAEVGKIMKDRGITCHTFNDDTSTTQSKNLETIVNWHNKQKRNLDISVHFNAHQSTANPMGTECLYLTQAELAKRVSAQIASAGSLIDRGPKKRTNLYFLNKTNKPAILIEVCFVDSSADADNYKKDFEKICTAIVDSTIV